jgi:hypothetical protein
MDAVAKEQREVADHVKPELPKISTPSGQIHQKLLKTKQQGGEKKLTAKDLEDILP